MEAPTGSVLTSPLANTRQAVAVGETEGQTSLGKGLGQESGAALGGLGLSDDDALQARLDALRRG